MTANVPRVMIAAAGSNSGKTTITCSILQALKMKGINPAAFKCGPDFIDPMFHTEVLGTKSRNLDLFLLSEEVCKYLLVKNSKEAHIAVLEGVMGYYDGLGIGDTTASSYHLAGVTKTPVILVISCSGAALSVAAQIQGFARFRPNSRIKGVILNNLSPALYPAYKEMIEHETNISVLGYFPTMMACSLESRHLGLITASEVENLQQKIDLLAKQALQSIDFDQLMAIARDSEEIDYLNYDIENIAAVTISVAKDKAFCFYYQDSLELLEQMGAKINYFSPLHDQKVPECDGLILGGGYPEIFAKELAGNKSMLKSVRDLLEKKIPCLAECGGFMYLLEHIADKEGNCYEMAGFLHGSAALTEKLHRFGYITLTAQQDNFLCKKGESINAHEFHYSDSTFNGDTFIAERPSGTSQWKCIHANDHLAAGYPHMHLWGNIAFAKSFIEECRKYKDMNLKHMYTLV